MNWKEIQGDIYLYDRFDLSSTLSCGQCFRWVENEEGKWKGVAFGKALSVYQTEEAVVFENTSAEDFLAFWVPYFDLESSDLLVHARLKETPLSADILDFCVPSAEKSLHILRQEPWEALCSFIFSQNNNIPRIQKIVAAFCENFGEPMENGEYAFPDCRKIAALTPEDLAPIRCGFRAKYVIDAAKKMASGEITPEKIAALSLADARLELQKIHGVGPKVAECTLLYGFHRMEAFPMDVWMIRAMKTLFPGISPEAFGDLAGIAQQYIFIYSRSHSDIFKD